ncbi:unnamed protein product [Paramecium sonneborni]|uniref:Uncharacterized protein n=1 Tax=Paramecium sonneborni TaxID=65129 RepID=A0A8S1MLY7_9CILI|nr:unnamed protein product [Paramecium sonneborni]
MLVDKQNYPQKQFQYSIICQIAMKSRQNWFCQQCIALDQSNSIILISEESLIRVFQFNKISLKQIQLLKNHRANIKTLRFFNKKERKFFSGSEDSSIIIWPQQLNSQVKFIQKLKGHIEGITCMIINGDNNLIISGGGDSCIKFWTILSPNDTELDRNIKHLQWSCQQTISDINNRILSLSINNLGNQVISCCSQNQILVIEYSTFSSIWMVKQKIKVDIWGRFISFLDNNFFVFFPYDGKYLYQYRTNSINNYFKISSILISCGEQFSELPPIYLSDQKLLIIWGFFSLNFFRITQNKKQSCKRKETFEFQKEHKIEFKQNCLKAIISQNGQYLISWNQNQSWIQICQFQEI